MGHRQAKPDRIDARPTAGALVVPYMVDATISPIDFKRVDPDHVKRCATARRCGICGRKIRGHQVALIGPDDGRKCFADPWMHVDCGRLAMVQCPFLASRSTWREDQDNPLLKTYAHNMALFIANDAEAHRDPLGAWHFRAIGPLKKG